MSQAKPNQDVMPATDVAKGFGFGDVVRCVGLSNQLLDNLDVQKRLHGDRWPEVMADLGTALQLHMKAIGETNAINAALPIARKMSDAGENPMIFIAVATEIANTPNAGTKARE